MVKVIVTDSDVEESLHLDRQGTLGEIRSNNHAVIMEGLPRILAHKLEKMIPENFRIKEIAMKISIEGKPFGMGLGGEALVKFGPE